jgi:hypothetical protein
MISKDIIRQNIAYICCERPGFLFNEGRLNDFAWVKLDTSTTRNFKKWTEGTIEYQEDEWGNIWWRKITGSAQGEVSIPVLKDWRNLETLKIPDYDDSARYETMRKQFAINSDKFCLADMPGWIFADARYMRGIQNYLMDLIQYPDELRHLHDIITAVYVKIIHQSAQAGADGIFFREDLGTQDRLLMSPQLWRKFFKEHYKNLTDIAHKNNLKVIMHSCGYNWAILDDLIESGVDCFQFDQPANYNMPELARKLKKHNVGLWSPLDIQKFLPTGNRSLIESKAKEMVDIFRGGLILCNYGDLAGIGIKKEWDMWAYNAFLQACGGSDLSKSMGVVNCQNK